MNIFLLHDPKLFTQCARFSHVGTWTLGKLCKKCGQPTSRLMEPLQIEWEPDSDNICDFSWCGYVGVVKHSVATHLIESGFECTLGTVSHIKPTRKTRKKIVPYPYTGPVINWLMPSKQIPLHEQKSGVDLIIDCQECGQKKYTFKTKGIVIDRKRWSGEKLFCIEQFTRSRAMFATEESIAIIEHRQITNIAFSKAGIIL